MLEPPPARGGPTPCIEEGSQTSVPVRSRLEAGFDHAAVSLLAEHESWRKELHAPATHIGKWWAQRLGTVTRAILLNAITPAGDKAICAAEPPLSGVTVLDPFLGSGTTLVEASKLGASIAGQDINPVAVLTARQALAEWDDERISAATQLITEQCAERIRVLFRTRDGASILGNFWVMVADCCECGAPVDLFSSYIFARHAYPQRYPVARAICPRCFRVVTVKLDTDKDISCEGCGERSPFQGPAQGDRAASGPVTSFVCASGHRSRIREALAKQAARYRMYASLVLDEGGRRQYVATTPDDLALYRRAQQELEANADLLVQPVGDLVAGRNTDQAVGWGFSSWSSFFNDRQLLCLGRIATSIRDLPDGLEREALAAVLMKTLEFNTICSTFKGEGTGAVRSLFHNHTLRPERTPFEANPWDGTGRDGNGSAGFAYALKRLGRASRSKRRPADLVRGEEGPAVVTGLSIPYARPLVQTLEGFVANPNAAYIATGSSTSVGLPDHSVDIVLTDPPFLANVSYSELADFFHAWLKGVRPFPDYSQDGTTRVEGEVQAPDPARFRAALGTIWREVGRVLRPGGVLAFSFHHSDASGWAALHQSLADAQFIVTNLVPVADEMVTSLSRAGAAEPTRLNAVVVCRHESHDPEPHAKDVEAALLQARDALGSLVDAGIDLGPGDVRSILRGTALARLTVPGADEDVPELCRVADAAAAAFWAGRDVRGRNSDQTAVAEPKPTTSTIVLVSRDAADPA
jgi:putative DNA methylase